MPRVELVSGRRAAGEGRARERGPGGQWWTHLGVVFLEKEKHADVVLERDDLGAREGAQRRRVGGRGLQRPQHVPREADVVEL